MKKIVKAEENLRLYIMFSSSQKSRSQFLLATPDFVSKKLHLRNEKVLCESNSQKSLMKRRLQEKLILGNWLDFLGGRFLS